MDRTKNTKTSPENAALQNQLKQLETNRNSLNKEKAKLIKDLEAERNAKKILENSLAQQKQSSNSLRDDNKLLRKNQAALQEQVKILEAKLSQAQIFHSHFGPELRNEHSQLHPSGSMQNQLQKENDALREKIKEFETEKALLELYKRREREELKKAADDEKRNINGKEISALKLKLEKTLQENQMIQSDLEMARSDLKNLEIQNNRNNTNEIHLNYSKLREALLRFSNEFDEREKHLPHLGSNNAEEVDIQKYLNFVSLNVERLTKLAENDT